MTQPTDASVPDASVPDAPVLSPESASGPTSQACLERVQSFRDELWPLTAIGPNIDARLKLPLVPKAKPLTERVTVIHVYDDRLLWSGDPVAEQELNARATEFARRLRELKTVPSGAMTLYLATDAATKSSRVRSIARRLPQDFVLRLVVARPGQWRHSAVSSSARVAEIKELRQDRTLGSRLPDLVASTFTCPGIVLAMKQIVDHTGAEKGKAFVIKMSEGLERCDCKLVDIDALQTYLFALLFRPAQYGWLALDRKRLPRGGASIGRWASRRARK